MRFCSEEATRGSSPAAIAGSSRGAGRAPDQTLRRQCSSELGSHKTCFDALSPSSSPRAFFSPPASTPRSVSQAGRRATPSASLDEKLSAAVTRGDVPGLVVIAATRDRILYQGVFGKAEVGRERPMTADAIFRIASMTKAVTSVAAMQLYEQGRFALDDPAEKYLPELANLMVFESFDNATGAYKVRPAAKKVTIRHLFTHTSGLGYGFTSPIVRDFKPRDGEKYRGGSAALRTWDTVDLWDGRRLGRAAG